MRSASPQLSLFDNEVPELGSSDLATELRDFRQFHKTTLVQSTAAPPGSSIPTFINEFWTAKQRAAHSLHEISYRACFKPQLPRFFIERLTAPGESVYDPFMGRGTTVVEAALLGRVPIGCDVNPLSQALVKPRLSPPTRNEVRERLEQIDFGASEDDPQELLTFYHPETLKEICSLRSYLVGREQVGIDETDQWIRMVALNRLTGHSPGFFSVYTLPPNQAVSLKSQVKINSKRNQTPPRRVVPELILRKTDDLLRDVEAASRTMLRSLGDRARLLTRSSDSTPEIDPESIALVVTSPPFLDVVDYTADNWLRTWFCGIDAADIQITMAKALPDWQSAMSKVFVELFRILLPGGHVAFEVGEVRGGKIKLEESVIPCGTEAGLIPELVLINDQQFTKTANCWGVDNQQKGTNTNRIVVFRKP